MNKKITIIMISIIVVSICATVGIVRANNSLISEEKLENLSEEDKEVKLEIAKYSDADVDFRKNMQTKILDKTYETSFVGVNEYNNKKVVYANEVGDEFEYDIETGKLWTADIRSNSNKKRDADIGIDKAHEIAMKFLSDDVDIDEYTRYAYCETSKGYFFWYIRYFGKYRSTDSFSATIGFDGSLVDLNDSTHIFNGKDIDFDEKYITAKIDELVKDKNAQNVDYDDATILLSKKGKISALVNYEIAHDKYVENYAKYISLE